MVSSFVPNVVGRLAPSPTGALHLGNARTFLLAWLSVRSRGGTLLLRIEDIDGPRNKRGAGEAAIADLAWLGLDWDGEPVLQSARTALYAAAVERLVAAGQVYPCVCSRKEVEEAGSAPHEAGDDGPVYPGTCRGRYADLGAARAATGREAALRFLVDVGAVPFDDLFAGPQPGRIRGDFVIQKRDGDPAYQLAVVVDDAAQGVTEVVRADDLLPSTPRQLLLYGALGLRPPVFAHVPLVIGADGLRLAKRHGDTSLRHLRERGRPPRRSSATSRSCAACARAAPVVRHASCSRTSGGRSCRGRPRAATTTGSSEPRLVGRGDAAAAAAAAAARQQSPAKARAACPASPAGAAAASAAAAVANRRCHAATSSDAAAAASRCAARASSSAGARWSAGSRSACAARSAGVRRVAAVAPSHCGAVNHAVKRPAAAMPVAIQRRSRRRWASCFVFSAAARSSSRLHCTATVRQCSTTRTRRPDGSAPRAVAASMCSSSSTVRTATARRAVASSLASNCVSASPACSSAILSSTSCRSCV
ncbi:MAG: tRNA glutamyl-Q(34) synthetase GluQRS [Planctomycetota bacterium]